MARLGRLGFLAVGVVFHLIYIYSIFDIYFVSPIVSGMRPYDVDAPAPAKRLFLVVGMGGITLRIGASLTSWYFFRRRSSCRQMLPTPPRSRRAFGNPLPLPLHPRQSSEPRNFWCFAHACSYGIPTRPCRAHCRSLRGCFCGYYRMEDEPRQL